jgi:hypothetical protein
MLFVLIGPSSETPDNIDYEYAQQELMNAQMGDDPVQEAISAIEKQHEEEKQGKNRVIQATRNGVKTGLGIW